MLSIGPGVDSRCAMRIWVWRYAPAWNDGGLIVMARDGGARFARFLLPTSSCPCLCARRNGRRAWPSARPPARPAWRPLLPFRARSWRLPPRRPRPRDASVRPLRPPGLFCLGARGGLGLALGLAALHLGIVGSRLGAKLVQNVLPRLHRGLLAVREVGSLNPLIDEALSLSLSGVGRTRRAEWRLGK